MMPTELDLKYNEKFTSEENANILQKLISWLISSMKPRFNPLFKQINNWLKALHKHHYTRLLYKERGTLDKDNRRLHKNNQLTEVKLLLGRFFLRKIDFNDIYYSLKKN